MPAEATGQTGQGSEPAYVGWRQNFYTLWAAEVVAIIGFQAVQPFLPYYIQTFDITDLDEALIWAGRMGTAAGLAMAISSPIWGYLADRHGRKPMVVRSMLGGGVAVILMAYVQSVEQLLIARVLQGALAGTVTACLTLVSTSTPRSHLGYALGLMQGAFMLGASVGPLLGGPLIESLGYKTCFLYSGITVIIAGIAVQIWVQEDFQRSRQVESSSKHRLPGRDVGRLFRIKAFLILVVSVTSMSFTFGFIMPVVPLFLQDLAGAGHGSIVSLAGMVFAAGGLTGAISSAVMGRFSDQLGPKRVMVWGLMAAAVFHLAQGFSQSVLALGLLIVLGGMATGAIRPVANALLARIIDEKDRGKAFGIMSSAAALGWAAGPIGGSWIGAHLGLRSVFFATAALFFVVGLWVWHAMEEPAVQPSLGVSQMLRGWRGRLRSRSTRDDR
ncbi:MAG: MFS transporter [Gemmatimonadetes bacterium]|jgi:MFS transporter, DHA1 family, multidrug resistance protein|nr:MFS transporter [Gemmatimonadota bacterium]MBT6144589.1 MFS transporter [Gemmatimonadota bacterium]MBT7860305.1 MFS transporter [Gemmatimonadota bacterium]